jgi:hypothetical protein
MKASVAMAYVLITPVTVNAKAVTNVQVRDRVLLVYHIVVGESMIKAADVLFLGECDIHCSQTNLLKTVIL